MQKSLVRKGFVIGIIILFVGASVIPSISGNDAFYLNNTHIDKENDISLINLENDSYTLVCIGGRIYNSTYMNGYIEVKTKNPCAYVNLLQYSMDNWYIEFRVGMFPDGTILQILPDHPLGIITDDFIFGIFKVLNMIK